MPAGQPGKAAGKGASRPAGPAPAAPPAPTGEWTEGGRRRNGQPAGGPKENGPPALSSQQIMEGLAAFFQQCGTRPQAVHAAAGRKPKPVWACGKCGFSANFDTRGSCFKCQAPRADGKVPAPARKPPAGGAAMRANSAPPAGQSAAGPTTSTTPTVQAEGVPAGPTPADKLALAKKKLEWAKAWPEEGDEKEAMVAKAQQAVTAAQAEVSAARPLGTQIKSLTDKMAAHTRTVAATTEALEAARAKVTELEGSLAAAQEALAATTAEHQALVRMADTGPPAQPATEATPTAVLLKLLLARSQDPQVTALLGTWVHQEGERQNEQKPPVEASAAGATMTAAPETAEPPSAGGADAPMGEPPNGKSPVGQGPAETRPAKRQCLIDKNTMKAAGLPQGLMQAIETAQARGAPLKVSLEHQTLIAKAAAEASLEPDRADQASQLAALAEAADVAMIA